MIGNYRNRRDPNNHIEFQYRRAYKDQQENTIVVSLRHTNDSTQNESPGKNDTDISKLEGDSNSIANESNQPSQIIGDSQRQLITKITKKSFNHFQPAFSPKIQNQYSNSEINLPQIQRISRQDAGNNSQIQNKSSTYASAIERKTSYGDLALQKKVLQQHKIIKDMESKDNLSRKTSGDNFYIPKQSQQQQQQSSMQINHHQNPFNHTENILTKTQTFKHLPNLYSPVNISSSQYYKQSVASKYEQSSLLNGNSSNMQSRLLEVKKRTSDLRLVFEGYKKIKYDQKQEPQQDQMFFLSTNTVGQIPKDKFQTIFKKVNSVKNIPYLEIQQQNSQRFLEKSIEKYNDRFENIKRYLQKNLQIFVIVVESKIPVQSFLKIGLFQLKGFQNSFIENNQTYLMDDFLKEVNEYFNKSDKLFLYRHLFSYDGNLIGTYEQIQPDQAFIYVSQICSFQTGIFEEKFKTKTLIKAMENLIIQDQNKSQAIHQNKSKQTKHQQQFSLDIRSPHKITKESIRKQAKELIDENRTNNRSIDNTNRSISSVSPNQKKPSDIRMVNSKSFKSLKEIQRETQLQSEMKEWDKMIMKQNKLNQDAINEIIEKNNHFEGQIQDEADQILSDGLNHLIDDGGLSIVDAKLTYNSTLADLRKESKAFNQQMKALKYELDYKLSVVTEKQVEDSIKEIQERTENELREKLMKEQEVKNEQYFRDTLSGQKKMQKNRKLQELIMILQRYIRDRKNSKQSIIKKDKNTRSQQQLPQLPQNRRQIVSKWDTNVKKSNTFKINGSFLNTTENHQTSIISKRSFANGALSPKGSNQTPINFVEKNIINNTGLNRNVFHQFGASFDKNIPILEQKSGFNRVEIIQIFSKFKALCEMTMKELKDKNQDLSQVKGVSFEKFLLGIPELKFETEKFAKRVFDQCNSNNSNDYLDWEHFLLAVKAIQARNIDSKIDLFFKIIDQDGNGTLSYEEVFEICSNSFEKFSPNVQEDHYMRALSEFFTSVIFRAVGKQFDEEIPLYEIKEAIDKNLPDSDLLCLFCNASKETGEEQD